MSLPRQVLPGCDYLITRRCSERRFFLRPDPETNNAFLYCLGLAALRTDVQIPFAVAMSNHYHAGLHDPRGEFPRFTECFHGLLTRHLNTRIERWENFWSGSAPSDVTLVEPKNVLDKMICAYPNPCAVDR